MSQAATEPVVIFEPFDNSKRTKFEGLCREEEDLLREIAALKRKVPGTVASRFAASTTERLKLDDEALASYVSSVVRAASSSASTSRDNGENDPANRSTVDIQPLPRQGDTERTLGEAVGGLGRLTKDMPATVAKMDRARQAGEYVVTRR